jgi:adenine nucleotide transporter 17
MTSTLPPLLQATAGGAASVVSSALVYPLDSVVSRMQVATKRRKGYETAPQALLTVVREEGWSSLFRGLGVDSLQTFISNFCYFYAYTALHKLLLIR